MKNTTRDIIGKLRHDRRIATNRGHSLGRIAAQYQQLRRDGYRLRVINPFCCGWVNTLVFSHWA